MVVAAYRCVHDFLMLQQTEYWRPSNSSFILIDSMDLSHKVNTRNYLVVKHPEEWALRHWMGSLAYRHLAGEDDVEEDLVIATEDPEGYLLMTPLVKRLISDIKTTTFGLTKGMT